MIVTKAVSSYLAALRPEPDPLLAEMEAQGAREGIPIVVPETGQLLALLATTRRARRVVEIGTAIGVSTLYLARAVPPDGTIVSFEIDERRQAAARGYLDRAGVLDRVDLRLEDARTGLGKMRGPFDMAFVDGVKTQYPEYLDLLLPLLEERALLVVDNVLMRGTVAEGRSDGEWSDAQIATARAFNERVLSLAEFEGAVLPVGDGVLVAVRR
jgi:predicted O-methyltransferase YrrM